MEQKSAKSSFYKRLRPISSRALYPVELFGFQMAPSPKQILSLAEGGKGTNGSRNYWTYPSKKHDPFRQRGAFRAISVADLRSSPPKIKLFEWKELAQYGTAANLQKNYPAYAAISHVWNQSDEVIALAKSVDRWLRIGLDNGSHSISWHGLREAADAASQLKCTYIWLDFTCIDQVAKNNDGQTPGDKDLQIANIANIYKFARAVIVMVGGVSAVQRVDKPSAWMDRAWTLQESTICKKSTWVYVTWPGVYAFKVNPGTAAEVDYKFKTVGPSSASKVLIKLLDLLQMPDLVKSITNPPDLKLPVEFQVRCLDGAADERSRSTARTALLAIIRARTPAQKKAGVWRSMLLRTSSRDIDIVYSVQVLLGIDVDPYGKRRGLQSLINDAALKSAVMGAPAWLGVGDMGGSIVPYESTSRLIPGKATYQEQNLPYYDLPDAKWQADEVIDSESYISSWSIRFPTVSLPHIVCAYMLRITKKVRAPWKVPKSKPRQQRCSLEFDYGGRAGDCWFRGKMAGYAAIVGTIGSFSPSRSKYDGFYHILFVSWDSTNYRWNVDGNGALKLKPKSGDKLPKHKWHFMVGRGAHLTTNRWPCDCYSAVGSPKKIHRSYGIQPLRDMGPTSNAAGKRPINWVVKKVLYFKPLLGAQLASQYSNQ